MAKYGQYGAYVQKGEGENRIFASLAPGQLIESLTLEEALKLFELPRTVGEFNGIPVICTKGRFGPYIKYGDKNISLPKGADPMTISLAECTGLIEKSADREANRIMASFEGSGIQVINGNYGPYIKQGNNNYRIPKGTDAASLTEEDCKTIIAESEPTGRKRKKKPLHS